MKLYPAIDLHLGRCVRLHQGQFDQATVYGDDPVAMAQSFKDQGAEVLHVVDLDGSRDGQTPHAAVIAALVRHTGLRVQVGGGIRSLETARAYLEAGVERVVVGSLAVRAPDVVLTMAKELGPERLVLALDVRPSPIDASCYSLAIHGWTEAAAVTPWAVLEGFLAAGVRQVLCTDISRDGALTGPNLGLYEQLLKCYPELSLLASGGVAALADLTALSHLALAGAVVGKALYSGRFTLAEALQCCAKD